MSEECKAEPVGYKCPPRDHQFRPGQSGNPSGRPKGARNFKTELREELSELVTIREGKRDVQVSKQRALIKTLLDAAIGGNQRAAATMLAMCVRLFAGGDDDEAIEGVEDRDIMESFSKRKKRAAAVGGNA